MQKVYILDFDGVIADTYQSSIKAVRKIMPKFTEQDFMNSLNGNVSSFPLYLRIIKRIISFFVLNEMSKLIKKDQPFPEVKQMLEVLAEKGNIVIVSAGRVKTMSRFLEVHSLQGYISEIWGGNGSIDKSRVLRGFCQKYASSKECCLFLTDTVSDIKQAKLAGIPVVAVLWGYQNQDILKTAEPDYFLAKPGDLGNLLVQIDIK